MTISPHITTDMTRYDQNTVRQLTEKYFSATITSEEMRLLSECAVDLTGDNPSFLISDNQMLEDLRLIALIDEHSALSLEKIAADTPPGLEASLEKHISELARSGRKRFLFTRILPVGIAAAVGLILVAPISDNIHTDTVRDAQLTLSESRPSTPGKNLMAKGQDADRNAVPLHHNIGNSTPSVNISNSPAPRNNESTPLPEKESANNAGSRHESYLTPEIPSIPDPLLDIKPMLSSAVIDPSIIMEQPLSTLNQTVSNVYESVNIVSTAFAGITETFEMVNSSLSALSPNAVEMNQF